MMEEQRNTPGVAVVIPMYNGRRWIGKTLEGVYGQTLAPAEIVVVDNGSSDGSVDFVRRCERVRLLHCTRQGGAHARQMGLQETQAPLLAFLDQDDWWHPEHLRHLVALLMSHEEAPAAFSSTRRFTDEVASVEPQLQVGDAVRWADPWDRFPANLIRTPSAVVVRRSALEEVGGWPTRFQVSDIQAWLLLATAHPFVGSNGVTVAKRRHHRSYGHQLRSSRPLHYYREVRNAVEAAYQYRCRCRGADADLQARLETMNALVALTRALQSTERAAFTRATEALEDSSTALSDNVLQKVVRHWLYHVRFFLKKDMLGAGNSMDLLLTGWSPSASRARSLVMPLVRGSFHRFYWWWYRAMRPWRVSRWMK